MTRPADTSDIDMAVTWRRQDKAVVTLPATYSRPGADYAEAAAYAIRATGDGFPEDLGEEAVPIAVVFIEDAR